MDRKQVMRMFNRETRIGALATATREGDVNVAVFGSPRMIDENTVVMAIGDNRSYKYLQENPRASFIVIEPGGAPATWTAAPAVLGAGTWLPVWQVGRTRETVRYGSTRDMESGPAGGWVLL